MGFREATQRNQNFKKSTSISTSNINKVNVPPATKRPSPASQHNTDWRMKDLIPSFETPKAYADEVYDTNIAAADAGTKFTQEGYDPNFDGIKEKNQDDLKMSLYDKNDPTQIHDKVPFMIGAYDFANWRWDFGGDGHTSRGASGEEQQGSTPTPEPTPEPTQEFKFRDSLSISEMPVNPKPVNPVKNATGFGVVDYIANNVQTQYYKLGSEVNKDQHSQALNQQSLYQFENLVQDKFSTLISTPNALNEDSFKNIKNLINNSNIPNVDKKRLLKEYKNKKTNYQKAIGTYKTDTPWLFDTSSGRKPNEAEALSLKIADGTITKKELDKWKLLTGSMPKGGTVTVKGGSMPRILTYEDLF